MDSPVWISSAEDTVLAKLLWAQMSGSEKKVRDAAGILEVQAEVIDNDYLDHWGSELDVAEWLAKARGANAEG
jgi:hypothetical protein